MTIEEEMKKLVTDFVDAVTDLAHRAAVAVLKGALVLPTKPKAKTKRKPVTTKAAKKQSAVERRKADARVAYKLRKWRKAGKKLSEVQQKWLSTYTAEHNR